MGAMDHESSALYTMIQTGLYRLILFHLHLDAIVANDCDACRSPHVTDLSPSATGKTYHASLVKTDCILILSLFVAQFAF